MTIEGEPVHADERYYRVDCAGVAIDTAGHTELERRVMGEWRWFARDEIAGHPEPIYPQDIVALIEASDAALPAGEAETRA